MIKTILGIILTVAVIIVFFAVIYKGVNNHDRYNTEI